jgi:outer membrane protein OmpA-like peptidoglycan-associated protein
MRTIALLFTTSLAAGAAHGADSLSYKAVRDVQVGDAAAKVIFEPGVSGTLDATVTCGTERFALRTAIAPGIPQTLHLEGLAEGHYRCAGNIVLEVSNGEAGEMSFELPVNVLPVFEVDASIDDIDIDNGRLVLSANRPVGEAMVEIFGAHGHLVATQMADTSEPGKAKFTWDAGAEVVKLVVQARDEYGFAYQRELTPWHYEIPHEEVHFGSGSHAIPADDAPKLESAWTEIVRLIDIYGSVVDIQLFVAGYTDTVGGAASNQELSNRRARSIATWFRNRGFRGKIHFQGFGETALLVQTQDETDDIRNRRALYVLSAQQPPASPHLPRSDWRTLP